jgi:hypothetical protein
MLSEVLERLHHRLELGELRPELFNVLASDSFHRDAGARFVVPEAQQLAGVVGGEVQGARDLGQEPDRFAGADHLHRYAAFPRGAADVDQAALNRFCMLQHFHPSHQSPAGFQRFRRSVLPTTLTLESAMAAPAMTGLRMPSAARGMPTTL